MIILESTYSQNDSKFGAAIIYINIIIPKRLVITYYSIGNVCSFDGFSDSMIVSMYVCTY
jgi:hypothetical protein